MFQFTNNNSNDCDFRPFVTDINKDESIDSGILVILKGLCRTYKTDGYGYFIASVLKLKSHLFLSDDMKVYITYWILKDLEMRTICRKFILKLRNKIKDKSPQNETLLDLQTKTSDYKNPVYIYKNNKYWIFSSDEIRRFFRRSLLINDMTESIPKTPSNPYTNEELHLYQLMHVYMQIGHLKLDENIHNYAKRYFDISLFKFYNNIELTNNATKEYLKTMTSRELVDASGFVHESMSIILKREDLPIDIKRCILKKYLIGEPLKRNAPLLWRYNINIEGEQNVKSRTYRRVRRRNRQL